MSSHTNSETVAPLDLSRWRNVPNWLILGGGFLVLIGAFVDRKQLGFSWLLAYMFYLSFGLGGLFLVLAHHLFDASWSVPIRRCCEHLACLLFPWMAILFIPLALLAPQIYPWMMMKVPDHALHAKQALLNKPMFYLLSAVCFVVWWRLTSGLRKWSLKQDESGAAECTFKMRGYSYWGIFAFAFTLTFAAVVWVKALEYEWFSTMYGVYYFADSIWATLASVYVITAILRRNGQLTNVVSSDTFYYIGSLLFAFTVFYAYIHFAQYFIIWNANMPEETFWYVLREKGSWWDIGMLIIFGHFFLPFLLLLRIDWKNSLPLMIPICVWAWVMRFCDQSYNIMPTPGAHPNGFVLHWMDVGCMALIGGLLIKAFLKSFNAHPPYPQRDPRMAESLGIYLPPDSAGPATSPGGAK